MSDNDSVIDLFPLGSVLLPHGRMPLQIFEPRYLDLVSTCLKNASGFGVVLIDKGDEVIRNKDQAEPRLKRYGCYGEIVHWDGLPNNRLAIIVEGRRVFEILDSWTEPRSKRMQAQVKFFDEETTIPLQPQQTDIDAIFTQLLQHPMIEALRYPQDWHDFNAVSFALAQLLPLSAQDRYELISENCEQRMQLLQRHIERLGGA